MLVAVNDHAELGAPVADVIVADYVVAGELQHPAERVADHGGADMPDVHGLGDVGGREVDDESSRLGDRGDAQPPIAQGRRQPLGEPGVAAAQVDEAGPGDFGRCAEIGHVEAAEQIGSHLAGRPAQSLAQRHGEVGLVIAELGVLAAADHRQQFFPVAGQVAQREAEPLFQFGQNAHGAKDKG